jgi:hypothetical protein
MVSTFFIMDLIAGENCNEFKQIAMRVFSVLFASLNQYDCSLHKPVCLNGTLIAILVGNLQLII